MRLCAPHGGPLPPPGSARQAAKPDTIRSGSSQSSGGSAVVAAGIVGALPATRRLLLRG